VFNIVKRAIAIANAAEAEEAVKDRVVHAEFIAEEASFNKARS
jgi:hypothetical protein